MKRRAPTRTVTAEETTRVALNHLDAAPNSAEDSDPAFKMVVAVPPDQYLEHGAGWFVLAGFDHDGNRHLYEGGCAI